MELNKICLILYLFGILATSFLADSATAPPDSDVSDIHGILDLITESPVHEDETHENDSDHESHHKEHRYSVATFDFSHVATPFIISVWILFASLAKIGIYFDTL